MYETSCGSMSYDVKILHIPWHLRSFLQFLQTPNRAKKFALAISNLARQLAVLERYERRALSRRRIAFRSFDTARRKSNSSKEWTAN
jgi:hypothetical protein